MAQFFDIMDLRAFAIVAKELNMRRAAEILHISQPPLSRKMKKLEEQIQVKLFIRHSNGLELTPAGNSVLDIIKPLFDLQANVQKQIAALAKNAEWSIGLTTAFEQGIYSAFTELLLKMDCIHPVIKRSSSIDLARNVAKGDLSAALVALPLSMAGLTLIDLHYTESLIAVVPEKWSVAATASPISLLELKNRPLFWFAPKRNPGWYELMDRAFTKIGFAPPLLEEPLEHDVLLSRIADGEGFALMPQSFAVIQRRGVRFIPALDLPQLALGIVYHSKAGEKPAQLCASLWKKCHDGK